MVLSGGHSGCPAATSSPGPPHCITPGCTMHRAGNTMCSSALEFLVTAWLRTLMTGIGNRLGGTAGSREGRALCHPVLMEGGMNYSVGLGWGVEAGKTSGEGDLGWDLRKVQEPTKWACIGDSLCPGLFSPTSHVRILRGGPGPHGQGKARPVSLATNILEEN